MTIAIPLQAGFELGQVVDRALSDEGKSFQRLIASITGYDTIDTLGDSRQRTVEAIAEAFAVAQTDNWDGVGSAPVDLSTMGYAIQFAKALPSVFPAPEIRVDRDGDLSFEWDRGPRQVFSVSVGRDGTLTYAGLFGHAKSHGVEHLREAIPLAVSTGISRATSDRYA